MGSSLFPDYNLEKKPYLELRFWKIFKGEKKSTGEKISAFIFEKKILDKKSEKEKDNILLCLRKEPETLIRGRNKHKNFLTVIESLKEDNNSLGFITEYINYNLISWIKNYHPSQFEIKYIIYQLLSVAIFLHSEYHISHNNLNPENIFINEKNFIKLTGFMFNTSIQKEINNNKGLIFSKNVVEVFFDLKYIAPELILNNEINNNSDNFVIGLISYYLLGNKNNNTDLIVLNDNSYDSFKNTYKNINIERKINKLNNDDFSKELLKNLLQNNSEKRKNLTQIQNSKFFIDSEDNNKLIPLCLLSKMESSEIANNYDLLKLLPNILNLYSKTEKESLVLPNLLYYLKIESLINPIVPSIFLLSEQNNKDINFEEKIWPSFKKLFYMKKLPAATLYITLKKISFLINNLDKLEFNKHCIPLIGKALDCGVQKIQEVILEELPNILKSMDKNEFQTKIYNRLVKIVIQTKNKIIRKKIINFFICLTDYFDSYFINNNFLDDIEKIIKSETTLNICKNAFILYEKIKLKVNNKSVRSKIIPSLLLMMCNGEISEDLFNQGEKIIHSYIEKIKEKRKDQFVQDIESDLEEKNNSNNNNNENNISNKNSKISKNNNNNIISSPLSVTRTKSTLSGNISLFEINSSEDSNLGVEEKNLNKKDKKEKGNNRNNKKKDLNNNNNLFDNLLNDNNEDIYNKNNDSSFDSTSLGKNQNEFNIGLKKEFLSSLELKKIEKKKKIENNNNDKKISCFSENKKTPWEEIESDDENTDELTRYIKPKKSKEEKSKNTEKKETKKNDRKKKWDEDEDEDEDINDNNLKDKKDEGDDTEPKDKIDNTKKQLDELLLKIDENEPNQKSNDNDTNPINKNYIYNEKEKKTESIKEKDEDKEVTKKGIKKKKKHKKKDKKEKNNNEDKNEEEIIDNEIKKNIDGNKEKSEEKKDKNKEKNGNIAQSQISTTKIRMNQRAAIIDLDSLLNDDD